MRKKTIGYDAKRIVRNGTGLGSYGRTLVNDLAPIMPDTTLRLYAPDAGRDDLRCQVQPRENVRFCYPRHLRFRLQRDWWRMKGVVKDLRRDGVELYHGLSGELPEGLSAAGIPGVVTVHDLIFLRHPEFYPALDAFFYKLKFRKMLREATRIIAISACTKRDILYYGDFPEDRIDLVYQSCSTRFSQPVSPSLLVEARRKYRLPQRYVLNVGTVELRKNILLGIRAMAKLPADLHLVIVGRQTKYQKQLDAEIRKLGLGNRIHFLQGVPNTLLPAVYRQAEAFIYPSRYEGFGVPVIEAIQSGLPVVAATGSCLEEAGGPDSLYVDPDDADGAAAAVLSAMENRMGMVERSRHYVRRFENQDVASQVLEVYGKALGKINR
ncbi:glycosyltransferase, group 1 family protein [Prevotella denticola CRIS 18C-A]|uniref:Glycosyltransferase, group 1 family protein n=1 Tax=Prevotella denticola CRIS 18C-A TaxID=944557 RepID=F0H8P7_9BACT|nr:glycosyltransferase family 1 protein [Prevotella denticola]EGC85659.1 glycosyltransferase, group 1 family protein [Prevotella denticola CRIS 18C-A]